MSTVHTAITSVTHNIPSFLREPAVALIGEQCYTILVYDFEILHTECLKLALSKGLGLGIVVGGGIVKIPQIVKIISTRSARGLSLAAYVLETASYAISLAYASRNNFPFSTYGENLFLTIQNVIITLLILYFSTPSGAQIGLGASPSRQSLGRPGGNIGTVIAGLAVAAGSGFVLWSDTLCPPALLSLLQAATLPISLLSKAPQIMSNHRAQSTGNLSAFAVFNALLGCLARIFTTQQEVNDPLIFYGFVGAAMLNLVLAVQMVMYWKTGERDVPSTQRMSATYEPMVETLPVKLGLEEGGTPGRRWARKLD